jgi:hypothetical protein
MPKKKIIIADTPEDLSGKDLSTEKSVEKSYGKKESLWDKVVEKGKKVEGHPISNSLNEEQISAVARQFKTKRDFMQVVMDLGEPFRYRLFDELGMMLTGRVDDQEKAKAVAEIFANCLDKEEVKDRETLYDCFFKKLQVLGRQPIEFIDVQKLKEVI